MLFLRRSKCRETHMHFFKKMLFAKWGGHEKFVWNGGVWRFGPENGGGTELRPKAARFRVPPPSACFWHLPYVITFKYFKVMKINHKQMCIFSYFVNFYTKNYVWINYKILFRKLNIFLSFYIFQYLGVHIIPYFY